jgi:hypothetical protein
MIKLKLSIFGKGSLLSEKYQGELCVDDYL